MFLRRLSFSQDHCKHLLTSTKRSALFSSRQQHKGGNRDNDYDDDINDYDYDNDGDDN